jgi:hypothetical protein
MRRAAPRMRRRNTPAVIGLTTPWEFHSMFTRLLSRCIDGISRRLVPPIAIPLRFALNRSFRWCVLIQSEMSSILMVVRKEFTAQPPYMRFI